MVKSAYSRKQEDPTPTVSVLIPTHNQEDFVRTAIESVLAQQTDFRYEIVVSDDCSYDATPEIINELVSQHPETIHARRHMSHLGGKQNFLQGLACCKGEFVALVEGDDYWTSHDKLQTQVDFLRRHPVYSACFHNVDVIDEDSGLSLGRFCSGDYKKTWELEDLLSRNVIPTCSVMFRRMAADQLPSWFATLQIGDWPLHILNAERGPIGYIDRCLGVYRVHRDSFWSSAAGPWRLDQEIRFFKAIDTHLNHTYHNVSLKRISERYYQLALARIPSGARAHSLLDALRAVWYRPWRGGVRATAMVGLFLTILCPWLHRHLKQAWFFGTTLSAFPSNGPRKANENSFSHLSVERPDERVKSSEISVRNVR
jgi:glycosyltransferase involved in cell wall biosynthesis